jgi:hypothetical protein
MKRRRSIHAAGEQEPKHEEREGDEPWTRSRRDALGRGYLCEHEGRSERRHVGGEPYPYPGSGASPNQRCGRDSWLSVRQLQVACTFESSGHGRI